MTGARSTRRHMMSTASKDANQHNILERSFIDVTTDAEKELLSTELDYSTRETGLARSLWSKQKGLFRTPPCPGQGRDDFWTEVQKMRGNNSATPTIVDDCLSEDDIALCFREKYNTLYNSVGYVPEEMARLRQEIEANACRHEGEMCPSHVLSVRDVTIA
ncbi:hypothetical protein CAPTEDRAFT_216232, partial [Capitella teleta]